VGPHFGLDPLQDDVGRRHHHDFAGVGIEGILARQERLAPNTAAALADQLAVAVIQSGEVFADLTGIRDHHPHKPDLNDRLVDHLHGGKQAVEVIGAFHQNLQLASAQAIGVHEPIRHLEVVMVGVAVCHVRANDRRDNLARWQRGAIVHGHNPDQVVRVLDHHRGETLAIADDRGHVFDDHLVVLAEREVIDAFFGDHHELRQVDGVSTFTQDLPLRTALTIMGQKVAYVLEVMRGGIRRQHLHRA